MAGRTRTDLLLEASLRCGMGLAEPVHSRQLYYVVHAVLGGRSKTTKNLQSCLNSGCKHGLWQRNAAVRDGLYWFGQDGLSRARSQFGHLALLLPRTPPGEVRLRLEGMAGHHEYVLDWVGSEWVVELNGDVGVDATDALELLASELKDPAIADKGQSGPERIYNEGVRLGWELTWLGPTLPTRVRAELPDGADEPVRHDVDSDVTDIGDDAGRAVDPATRRRIEAHAMAMAIRWCRERYTEVEDVSAQKVGYDIRCRGPEGELAVEVKGTTTPGASVELTSGEVKTLKARHPHTALFVVSNVEVQGSSVAGGDVAVWMPFDPAEFALQPTAYRCRLDSRSGKGG